MPSQAQAQARSPMPPQPPSWTASRSGSAGARRVRLPAAMRAQPFWLFGLPMILFVVAGSLGLSQFAQAKYQVSDSKRLVRARPPALAHTPSRPPTHLCLCTRTHALTPPTRVFSCRRCQRRRSKTCASRATSLTCSRSTGSVPHATRPSSPSPSASPNPVARATPPTAAAGAGQGRRLEDCPHATTARAADRQRVTVKSRSNVQRHACTTMYRSFTSIPALSNDNDRPTMLRARLEVLRLLRPPPPPPPPFGLAVTMSRSPACRGAGRPR